MNRIPPWVNVLGTAVASALLTGVATDRLAVQPAKVEISAAGAFSAEVYDTLTECIQGRKVCEEELRACRNSQ